LRNHSGKIGSRGKAGKLETRLAITLGTNAIAQRKAKATTGGSLLYSSTAITIFD
jgi:hypothetical protein